MPKLYLPVKTGIRSLEHLMLAEVVMKFLHLLVLLAITCQHSLTLTTTNFGPACSSSSTVLKVEIPLDLPQNFSAKSRGNGFLIEICDPEESVNTFLTSTPQNNLTKVIADIWAYCLPNVVFSEKIIKKTTTSWVGQCDLLVMDYAEINPNRCAKAIAQRDGNISYLLLIEGPIDKVDKYFPQIRAIYTCLTHKEKDLKDSRAATADAIKASNEKIAKELEDETEKSKPNNEIKTTTSYTQKLEKIKMKLQQFLEVPEISGVPKTILRIGKLSSFLAMNLGKLKQLVVAKTKRI